ncbi:hypothetical protein C0991_011679 [Blastosporella zonata]|nr:hypothetical protein C0991_011679 [Blastosporella zonata]
MQEVSSSGRKGGLLGLGLLRAPCHPYQRQSPAHDGQRETWYANHLLYTAIVKGKVNVDVELLKPIIADVHDILAGALVSVKLLIGSPVDFILTLDGKVLAAVDVCHILISVLVLVHSILACVLHVVAAASIKVVTPLIAAVASVLVEVLVVIFVNLKAGIFVAIGPLLTPALFNALAAINLNVVVAVLKKGTN